MEENTKAQIAKDRICGIYKITNPKGKIYVGQSINIEHRFFMYKHYHCKRQPKLYNSLIKYGADAHKFEIIYTCISTDNITNELNKWEIYYVNLFQAAHPQYGLNLKDGGGGYGSHNEETRKKLSEINKGRKLSDEHKRNIGIASKAAMTPELRRKIGEQSKGRKHSDETKKKMSEMKMGRKLSEETKQKLRDINTGKTTPEDVREKISKSNIGKHNYPREKLSDESKMKISERMKGEKHPMYGKKHSPETLLKMRGRSGEKSPLYGIPRSEEVKKKISEAQKGREKTAEQRKKMSEAGKGRIPWNKGLKNPYSDETKEKMSASHIGKTITDETKRKMSESKKKRRLDGSKTKEKPPQNG